MIISFFCQKAYSELQILRVTHTASWGGNIPLETHLYLGPVLLFYIWAKVPVRVIGPPLEALNFRYSWHA